MKKQTKSIKTSKAVIAVIIFLAMPLLFADCGKIHNEMYGEKSITIVNRLSSSINVEYTFPHEQRYKNLGRVSANSSRTFKISGVDCTYSFRAESPEKFYWLNKRNICGGAEWEIP